jgi:hypothetical protein
MFDMSTKSVPCVPTHVTLALPPESAAVASRIAAEQHWSFADAVLFLVKRGVKAQEAAERTVADRYERFMKSDVKEQQTTGDDLIRAVFGPESIA